MNKKLMAILLTACMLIALLPVSAVAAGRDGMRSPTVLTFSSDVHNGSDNTSANRLSNWLDNITAAYGKPDAMGFCGDMGSASAGEADFWTYTQSVMNVVSNKGVTGVYTTGNHEIYNGNYNSTSNSVKNNYVVGGEGREGSDYRIYCLGTSNWNNNSDNYTQDQVNALTSYLNSVGNDKPIIVLTHFPLHTASGGSSWWGGGRQTTNADLVIDALNAGVSAGKTIVLLWGHNHTVSDTYYDEIYYPGTTLNYSSSGSKTINFIYAAAGCMSDSEYGSGSAYVKGKGLVIIINGSELDFHYYDANGNDVTENSTNPTDIPVISEDPGTTPSAGTIQDGHRYVIYSNDGYALSSAASETGYTNTGSSSSQQYNYRGLEGVAYTAGQTVTTDMLWTFYADGNGYIIQSEDGRYLNGTYVSNSTGGYDGTLKLDGDLDIWTISNNLYKSTNASNGNSSDKFLSHGNGSNSGGNTNIFSIRSESNATSMTVYEYNADGTYAGSDTPTVTPIPGNTETRYVETNSFVSGNDYIIGVTADSGSIYAIAYDSSVTAKNVPLVNDSTPYIVTTDSTVIWTRTSSGYLQMGSRYLYPTSSNSVTTYTSGREINYSNGQLSFSTSSSGTYYMTYADGAFATTSSQSSASTFRLFVKTEVSGGDPTNTPTVTPTATPTAATTTDPIIGTTQPIDGRKYVIISSDGYALTSTGDTTGYSNNGSGSQVYNYIGLEGQAYTVGQHVTTDLLWSFYADGNSYMIQSQDGRFLNASYVLNSTGGYDGTLKLDGELDLWTIVSGNLLLSANASTSDRGDKYLTHGNSSGNNNYNIFCVRSEEYATSFILYEYDDNGDIVGGNSGSTETPTATPTNTPAVTATPTAVPTAGTTEIHYIETNSLVAGNDYVIGVTRDSGSIYAIAYNGSSSSSSSVSAVTMNVVNDSTPYVMTDNSNAVWTRTSAGYLQTGSRYLYPTSSNGVMTYTDGRVINYVNGHFAYDTTSSGTYYVTCSNGSFGTTNNESEAATIRVFVKTVVVVGGEDPTPTPTATPTPTPTPTPTATVAPTVAPTGVMGDVNGDGSVTVADATLLLRYIHGLIGEDQLNLDVADVSGDGRCTATDSLLILRYVLGIIESL